MRNVYKEIDREINASRDGSSKKYLLVILSTKLCEKKELNEKERLVYIMKHKKFTLGMVALIVLLIVLLIGCGTILGLALDGETSTSISQGEIIDSEIEVKGTGELKWYGETSLISEEMVLPNNIVNSDAALNDFLYSDSTVALLVEIPEENIYVYGLKENGTDGENDYLYYCHGICIRQGNEIQVIDIDWGIYRDIPQIQYEDYDDDGQKEIAMILRSASGTDLSLLDLHIFEKSDDGGLIDNYFTDWAEQLYKMVTYEIDENRILKLYVEGIQFEEVDISTLEDEWGEKFKELAFGNNVKIFFEDGKIYLQVYPMVNVGNWVTPQEITNVYFQTEVKYNNGYKLSYN